MTERDHISALISMGTKAQCENTRTRTGETKNKYLESLDLRGCVDYEEYRLIRVKAFLDVQRGLVLRTLEDLVHYREFAAILHHQPQTTSAAMSGFPQDNENSRTRGANNALASENSSRANLSKNFTTLRPASLQTAPLTTSGAAAPPNAPQPGQEGIRRNLIRPPAEEREDEHAAAEVTMAMCLSDANFLDAQRGIVDHLLHSFYDQWGILQEYRNNFLATDRPTRAPTYHDVVRFQKAVNHIIGYYREPAFVNYLKVEQQHLNEPTFKDSVRIIMPQEPQQQEPVVDVTQDEQEIVQPVVPSNTTT